MPDGDAKSLLDEAIRRIQSETNPAGALPPTQSVQRELGVAPRKESFSERNFGGLPIDTSSGAPAWVRLGVSSREKKEEKLGFLNEIYGANSARFADTGEILVKVLDPSSNAPKEMLVNEEGISGGDFTALAAYAPETLGAMLAIRGGRGIPGIGKMGGAKGLLRDVAAEAVGQETGGAAKDIAVRATDANPVNLEEIAERRIGNLPFDAAFGAAMGIGGKVISKAVTPMLGAKEVVDLEAKAGVQHLKENLGVEIPQSIGEMTGGKVFKRLEATASMLPGSSKYFTDLLEKKTAAIRSVANKIMGIPEGGTVPSAETVSEEAVQAIRSKLTPVQQALESARGSVIKEANETILKELESATVSERQIYPEKVGASIREAIFSKREGFRNQSRQNYEEALSLPGGRDRVFETPSLSKKAKNLLDTLPQKTEMAEEIAYDTYGNPITATKEGKSVSKEFVPESVVGKLKELSSNPEEKRSLSDLISMRSEVDNEIAAGESVPGRQTKYLTSIREALTGAIDEAVSGAETPELKAAFEKANTFYRQNVGQFKDRYISRLFREIDQGGGFTNDEDIIRNIGPTEYASFKKVLGESSPQFQQLRRAIVDELYNSSILPGEEVVSGKAFQKNLANFYKKNRSIAEDILGGRGVNLQRMGEILDAVDSKIDAGKLSAAVKAGEPVDDAVKRLVVEQKKLDELYRSKLVKEIGEGRVGETFNSADFVNRFMDSGSPKEIQSVMAQLADRPEVVEDLRRKVIQRVMFEAQRRAKSTDPASLGLGDPLLPPNSESLRQAIGDVDKRGNLQTIIGRDAYDNLMALAKVVRGSESTEAAFRSAGGLSAGTQLSKLIHGGVLGYASNYVKQKFAAIVLASPILRAWVSNATMQTPLEIGGKTLATTKDAALVTTLIGSTPFIEAVVDEMGEGTKAQSFIEALRNSSIMHDQQTEIRGKRATQQDEARRLLNQKVFEIKGTNQPVNP